MIFISAPYSHKDKSVVNYRYNQTLKYAHHLMLEQLNAISPVVYGHAIVEQYPEIDNTWGTWNAFCEELISYCDKIHILMLDGWDESIGIFSEIDYFLEQNRERPIEKRIDDHWMILKKIVFIDAQTFKPIDEKENAGIYKKWQTDWQIDIPEINTKTKL